MLRKLLFLVSFFAVIVPAAPCMAQPDTTDIIGWWSFDEGWGSIAADGSGNGNEATLYGDLDWVLGVYGMALDFDDDEAYVGTDQSLLDDLTAFTMAGWISAGNVGVYSSLFGQNDLIEFGFTTENGGQLGTWMAGNDWAFVGADCDFPYPSWHHVALTGDPDRVVIYIDGVEVASDEGGMTSSGTSTYGFNIGGSVFNTSGDPFEGQIDDVWLFARALTRAEMQILMRGANDSRLASTPSPADEESDVPRDTGLSWARGEFAVVHDVYFGPAFDDVNAAGRDDPRGVLLSQGRTETSIEFEANLEYGRTYYWRVDEVNVPADGTIFKGRIWSFVVEPFAYGIEDIRVSGNTTSPDGQGLENIINGSGLDDNDRHSTDQMEMWLGVADEDEPVELQFDFDRVYQLHEMLVWNYNVMFEPMVGAGFKDVTVTYSADGVAWMPLGDVEFAQATAMSTYTANTTVAFEGVAARHVRLTVNSNYGGSTSFGLSEVRFLSIPAQARRPEPVDGAVGVAPGTALTWRSGRHAGVHEVYLGTASDTLALIETVTEPISTAGELNLGYTYYWRVDEVNEADTIPSWAGEIWNFSTREFAPIEDFEDYDDDENRIYDTWSDGWINGTRATVGYYEAPFAERTLVNSGRQSMPLGYDNTQAPYYAEAGYELDGMDLTVHGADALRLFVYGRSPAFYEADDGTILMNAIGADIWDEADEFRFAYLTLNGDGAMTARVDSLDGTPNEWAKGGVMVRQSVEPGAPHTMMILTGGGGNGASWQGRVTADATSENEDATEVVAPPYWVKVERSGNDFSGFVSPDGVTWTQIGTARTIAMTDPVLIGLALTSHNADQATGAGFANVTSTGNVSGDWEVAEIGVDQPSSGNLPEPFYAVLEDAAGAAVTVENPDGNVTAKSGWNEWLIPFADLAGIDLSRVQKLTLGIGSPDAPSATSEGLVFVDDIGYGHQAGDR